MSGKTSHGASRKHPGIKGLSPHLKAMRIRDAEGIAGVDGCIEDGRNVKWRKLSFTEQLAILNRKFPDGAVKQKERIITRMQAAQNKPLATESAKKDRVEDDAKKLSSREKKLEEQKVARDAARYETKA